MASEHSENISQGIPSQQSSPPAMTSSIPPPAPPPLPARQRGVKLTSSNLPKLPNASFSRSLQDPVSQLDAHYAHLQKHVKVVKRKNPNRLPTPSLCQFQTTLDDGTVSTEWLKYMKEWVHYFIQSAASDRIDDKLEPFSFEIMKSGCDRLYHLSAPFLEPMQQLVRIYEWRNIPLSGSLFSAYFLLCYMDLLGVSLCIGLAFLVISIRVQSFAILGVEAMTDNSSSRQSYDEDSCSNDHDDKETPRKPWRQRLGQAGDMFTLSYPRCNSFSQPGDGMAPEAKSVKQWRTDILTNYGSTVQLFVLDVVDKLERLKNLITWKRPARTRALLLLLVVGAITLYYIPYRYVVKSVFYWLGIELFVLQYLRTFYPRYRRLFNIIDWVLWGVPNDAEYAMEVIRLGRHNIIQQGNEETSGTEWQQLQQQQQQQKQLDHKPLPPSSSSSSASCSVSSIRQQKRRSSLGDESSASANSTSSMICDDNFDANNNDIKDDGSMDDNDGKKEKPVDGALQQDKKYGKALMTTTKIATMMASTAVDQVKQLIESRLDKDVVNKSGDKKQAPDLEDKDRPSYGCMYQGSIPGRLVILDHGFQFRSSRLTGSRLLVDLEWKQVVSVRKTKSVDAYVFHTNGLEIDVADGQMLPFENVLKRDECFMYLVSSGEHW